MAAAVCCAAAGCMGFLYANSTRATQALLGNMLLEKLSQLQLRDVKFFNDQRLLNEHLALVGVLACMHACRPPDAGTHGGLTAHAELVTGRFALTPRV